MSPAVKSDESHRSRGHYVEVSGLDHTVSIWDSKECPGAGVKHGSIALGAEGGIYTGVPAVAGRMMWPTAVAKESWSMRLMSTGMNAWSSTVSYHIRMQRSLVINGAI